VACSLDYFEYDYALSPLSDVVWIVVVIGAAFLLAATTTGRYLWLRWVARAAEHAAGAVQDRLHADTASRSPQSAEPAPRRPEAHSDAAVVFNLAVALAERYDYAGAIAAYERSEQRGEVDAAFNLGVLLYETGDIAGAEAAWRRAVQRGHVQAAANLGFLLHGRGDLVGKRLVHLRRRHLPYATGPGAGSIPAMGSSELAYRRADAHGDATAAFNLGVLLHQRHDYADAIAAYERSEQHGDVDAAFNLGVLLYEIGELDGAQAAWRRAAAHGHAPAAGNLAFLSARHGPNMQADVH